MFRTESGNYFSFYFFPKSGPSWEGCWLAPCCWQRLFALLGALRSPWEVWHPCNCSAWYLVPLKLPSISLGWQFAALEAQSFGNLGQKLGEKWQILLEAFLSIALWIISWQKIIQGRANLYIPRIPFFHPWYTHHCFWWKNLWRATAAPYGLQGHCVKSGTIKITTSACFSASVLTFRCGTGLAIFVSDLL